MRERERMQLLGCSLSHPAGQPCRGGEIIMEHGMSADVSILASCRLVTDGVEAGA